MTYSFATAHSNEILCFLLSFVITTIVLIIILGFVYTKLVFRAKRKYHIIV